MTGEMATHGRVGGPVIIDKDGYVMTALSPRQSSFAEPGISRPAEFPAARPFGAVGRFFAGFAADIREYGRRRRVVSELSRLSDRELADIGLTRSDISQVFTPEFAARRKAEGRT